MYLKQYPPLNVLQILYLYKNVMSVWLPESSVRPIELCQMELPTMILIIVITHMTYLDVPEVIIIDYFFQTLDKSFDNLKMYFILYLL